MADVIVKEIQQNLVPVEDFLVTLEAEPERFNKYLIPVVKRILSNREISEKVKKDSAASSC